MISVSVFIELRVASELGLSLSLSLDEEEEDWHGILDKALRYVDVGIDFIGSYIFI